MRVFLQQRLCVSARSPASKVLPALLAPPPACLQDASLEWVAFNFMAQDHPLVHAMRQQARPARCLTPAQLLKFWSPAGRCCLPRALQQPM